MKAPSGLKMISPKDFHVLRSRFNGAEHTLFDNLCMHTFRSAGDLFML